jgi:hypothetical protein
MSRFSDFSLYKRTDELLRPAEKDLSDRFYSTENIQLVYKKALSDIDKGVSYSHVMTTMDAVFRLAITRREDFPAVSDMNAGVLRKVYNDTARVNVSQKQYTERVFSKNNIPTNFLPRPSYRSLNDGDDDEDDNTIELLRR